jgi:integrase/recombinase XerD
MCLYAQAISSFLAHCRYEKNLSPKTLKAYSTDLTQLAQFLFKNNFSSDIDAITKRELKLYLEHINSCQPKTIKRKVAAIKTLFNYLEFEDLIQLNPIRKMRISIKEPKRLPKVMELKEIELMIKISYNKLKELKQSSYSYHEALRNIVVVELLFSTGARVSEIANLRKEDIDITTGAIIIKGKGDKERIIQVCNQEVLKSLQRVS